MGFFLIADDIGFHIAIARSTHNFLRVHLLRHLFDISGQFLDSVLRELAKAHTNLPSVVAQHRQ